MKAKITNNLLKRLKTTGAGYDVNDTELPGFALRVSAEGKATSYSVRYRMPNGRRQRLKIGSSKVLTPQQARTQAQVALADATKGDDPQDIKKHLRGVKTLGRFVEEEYAPHVLAHLKSGEQTLKRLKSCFGGLWNRHLTDHTWHSMVLEWRAARIDSGKTKGTANRDVASLRAVFSQAVRLDILDLNPL